jgi:diguanylate cyclase (GGDEF)-like protein
MALARDEAVAASQVDPLTGLDSRAHCLSKLALALALAARQGIAVSALMIDLDHFKRVNDTWGHAAGDAVLREVGQALRGLVRSGDSVGRYGGEELLMVLPATDAVTAAVVAERVRAAVAALAVPGVPGVTASLGGATALPGEDAAALLARADAALYVAKAAGRDQVRMAGEPPATAP